MADREWPRLLDVTLRDGGYVNGHSFSVVEAERLVSTLAGAGLSLIEVGYIRPRRHGSADGRVVACCPASYLARLHQAAGTAQLVVMVHAADVELSDYSLLAENCVSLVLFPTTPAKVNGLGPHIYMVRSLGLRATVNLIRASERSRSEIALVATRAETLGADVFYLADSNGSLFPDDVASLLAHARSNTSLPIGFHPHDGLRLAFANALRALEAGCSYLDASLTGLGKGGGNLVLELTAGYLRSHFGHTYSIGPLIQVSS